MCPAALDSPAVLPERKEQGAVMFGLANGAVQFVMMRGSAQRPQSQSIHFGYSNVLQTRVRLLTGVEPERRKKPRQADDRCPGGRESQEQVPVERKVQRSI